MGALHLAILDYKTTFDVSPSAGKCSTLFQHLHKQPSKIVFTESNYIVSLNRHFKVLTIFFSLKRFKNLFTEAGFQIQNHYYHHNETFFNLLTMNA